MIQGVLVIRSRNHNGAQLPAPLLPLPHPRVPQHGHLQHSTFVATAEHTFLHRYQCSQASYSICCKEHTLAAQFWSSPVQLLVCKQSTPYSHTTEQRIHTKSTLLLAWCKHQLHFHAIFRWNQQSLSTAALHMDIASTFHEPVPISVLVNDFQIFCT